MAVGGGWRCRAGAGGGGGGRDTQITKFLNEFEVSVRYKLSTLAERVSSLERHLEYCEIASKKKEELQQLNSGSEPFPSGS